MVTAALRKLVASLDQAKNRRDTGLFAAEGTKCVLETIGHFDCVHLIATSSWLDAHSGALASAPNIAEASRADMERMTHFTTPPQVIAVYRIRQHTIAAADIAGQLTIALDRIQDPGNLGTIIRAADWFGIKNIVCSPDTVDCYNPKVVQATMGAIARVKVSYTPLDIFIAEARKESIPVCGTFLDGNNIYTTTLPVSSALIVMGNEGSGVSGEVAHLVNHRLLIPPYPATATTVESLNVAVATAITLAEFRRQSIQ